MLRVSCSVVPCLWAAAICHGSIYGIDFNGVLYDVSPATGQATNPRATGLVNPIDIEFSGDGTLYAVTANTTPGQMPGLWQIDPGSGAPTFISGVQGLDLGVMVEGDLAFGSGVMYSIGAAFSGTLRTISLADGTTTPIGSNGFESDWSALSFDASGSLFVVNTGAGGAPTSTLLRLDPATGATISSITLNQDLGGWAAMDLDPSTGTLYVADGGIASPGTDSLYTLDTATGTLTLVGSLELADGLSGLAIIPEPATAVYALIVCAIAAWRRQR
ncbi:MAG TPA: hypothetical protein VNT79_15755 [Phycisphaerae bacterium]|nr:hypothetical protein [Phycisphaerae bacterium]